METITQRTTDNIRGFLYKKGSTILNITKDEYLKYKRELSGLYMKLNEKIIPSSVRKIVNYQEMLNDSKNYSSFELFYESYLGGKEDIIETQSKIMVEKAKEINIEITEEVATKAIIVRLGNAYIGYYMENIVIEKLSNLTDYITCTKVSDAVDMEFKVDAEIEFAGINKIAIQIKPTTYLKYKAKDETPFHENYFKKFNCKVVYFLYDNEYNIFINNKRYSLEKSDVLTDVIEKLLLEGEY